MAKKFRLRPSVGGHRVVTRKETGEIDSVVDYVGGDVIETDVDLCAMFANKFDEVVVEKAPAKAKTSRFAKKSEMSSAKAKAKEDAKSAATGTPSSQK